MEGADEVLALGRVDAGLAADGGVDLRQQRGRDLHEAHAATHDAGGEAGEIADHAAAERDHEIAALEPHLEQALRQRAPARRSSWSPRRAPGLRAGAQPGGLQAPPRAAPDGGAATLSSVTMPHLTAPSRALDEVGLPQRSGRGRSAPRRSGCRARLGSRRTPAVRLGCGGLDGVALMGLAHRAVSALPAAAQGLRQRVDDLRHDDLVRQVAALDGDVGRRRRSGSAPPSARRMTRLGVLLQQRAVVPLEHAAHQHAAARP